MIYLVASIWTDLLLPLTQQGKITEIVVNTAAFINSLASSSPLPITASHTQARVRRHAAAFHSYGRSQ